MIIRSYLEGPRWISLRQVLYDCARGLGIKLTIENEEKGWLRKTIFFTAEGELDNMHRFRDRLAREVGDC